jgi:HMG-box domain
MDVQPRLSQRVSPATIAADDEAENEAVRNLCDSSMVSGNSKKPRPKWRKPAGKPHHPRTGYNLFFQFERERMLSNMEHVPITWYDVANLQVDSGPRMKNAQAPSGERTIRRPSSEKLGFAGLARNIASKWKSLDSEIKSVFDQKAEEDRNRYKQELELWNEQQKHQSQRLQVQAALDDALNMSSRSRNENVPSDQQQVLDNRFYTINPKTMESESLSDFSSFPLETECQVSKHQVSQQVCQDSNGFLQGQIRGRLSPSECQNIANLESLSTPLGNSVDKTVTFSRLQPAVVSPPEPKSKSRPLGVRRGGDPRDREGLFENVEVLQSSSSDISITINRFIGEVYGLSTKLHELATERYVNFRKETSPELQEIERQLMFCTDEVRRLSSHLQAFDSAARSASVKKQCEDRRLQTLPSFPNAGNTICESRDHEYNAFDIPSLMHDVRRTLDYVNQRSNEEIRVADESQRRISEYEFNAPLQMGCGPRKFSRHNSDGVIFQQHVPQPRRLSHMNEPQYRMCVPGDYSYEVQVNDPQGLFSTAVSHSSSSTLMSPYPTEERYEYPAESTVTNFASPAQAVNRYRMMQMQRSRSDPLGCGLYPQQVSVVERVEQQRLVPLQVVANRGNNPARRRLENDVYLSNIRNRSAAFVGEDAAFLAANEAMIQDDTFNSTMNFFDDGAYGVDNFEFDPNNDMESMSSHLSM